MRLGGNPIRFGASLTRFASMSIKFMNILMRLGSTLGLDRHRPKADPERTTLSQPRSTPQELGPTLDERRCKPDQSMNKPLSILIYTCSATTKRWSMPSIRTQSAPDAISPQLGCFSYVNAHLPWPKELGPAKRIRTSQPHVLVSNYESNRHEPS